MNYPSLTQFKITPAQLTTLTDMKQNGTTGYYKAPTWGALVKKGLVDLVHSKVSTRLTVTPIGERAVTEVHTSLKELLLDIPNRMQEMKLFGYDGEPYMAKVLVPDQGDHFEFKFLANLGYLKTTNEITFRTTEKYDEVVKSKGFANRQYIL